MNKVYKTVWNALRGQLVVVNEVTTAHSQANTHKTSTVLISSTVTPQFAKATLATVIAGLISTSALAFTGDKVLNNAWDLSGGTTHFNSLVVQSKGDLTINKEITSDGESFNDPDAKLEVNTTLTNQGKIHGDANLAGKKIVNEATGAIDMGKVSVVTPQKDNEALVNKGTMKVGTLEAGVATVKNEKDLEVTNALAVEGKLVNTASATKLKLADATVTGEIANDAKTGVDVATLNVTGMGKVTGQGKMTVTDTLTVAENASFAQNELDAVSTVTNAGTMNVQTLKQTQQKGVFTNQKTANFADVDGVGTITNAATGTMKVTGALNVKHLASNAGTLNAQTLNVEGEAATFTNSKEATIANASGTGSIVNDRTGTLNVTDTLTVQNTVTNTGAMTAKTVNVNSGVLNSAGTQLKVTAMNVEGGTLKNTATTGTEIGTLTVNTGKIEGTGAMTVTGATALKQGASIAQQDLTLNTLDADGVLNVSGQFVGNGISTFKANATGTIANANFKGDVDHSGQMVINAATSDANIRNTAGNLTIKSLEGNANVTNAAGATLNMSAGAAHMASLAGAGTTQLGVATATGKISNTGTMTSTGLVTSGAFDQNAQSAHLAGLKVNGLLNVAGGDLTVDGTLTANQAQNASTIVATNLTITGGLVNDKSITSTQSADLTGFTQHGTGKSQFKDVDLKGNGTLDGTTVADGNLVVDLGAHYEGSGSVTSKGTLKVSGDFLSTGRVEAQGTTGVGKSGTLKAKNLVLAQTDIAGTLESVGESSIRNLYLREGAILKNSGALTVNAVRTTAGGTYEQTGDNASITFTDGTWFANTQVNLFGGVMDRSGTHLGQRNSYLVKSDSYKGALNGDIANTNWKDGMAILKVGKLTPFNKVEVQKGGLVEVQQISMSGSIAKGPTLLLNGGAMETTLDQFFNGVKSDALAWEALNPETGRIDVIGSSILGVNSVGELNAGIQDYVKFTTGDLIFKDSIDFGQITTVSNKLQPLGDVSLHFLGKTNKLMTVDVANSLSDSNKPTKIIFDRNSLYASTSDAPTAGKAVYVGGTATPDGLSLKSGVGFQNVLLTDKVTVQQGAEFTLIGKEDQKHGALIGEQGGTINVTGEGSKFILGTLGRTGMTGKLDKASTTTGGLIYAKGGDYQIDTLEAVNGGKIETGASNLTTTTNLKVTGAGSTLDNAGTLKITNLTDDANAVIGNAGVMNVVSATNVLGQITNKKGGTIKVDGKLTVTGKLINEAAEVTRGGQTGIQVGALDVVSDQAVINKGVFVSNGENVITGSSADNPLTSGKYAFHNQKGAVADLSKGLTTIGAAPSLATSSVETRSEGGYTVVKNEGGMKLGNVVVNDFATLRNTGVDAQIEIEKLSMDGWSTFENSGTATIKTMEAYGLIRNKGTIQSSKLEATNFTNSAKGSEGKGLIVDETLNVIEGGQFKNDKDGIVDASKAKMSLAAKAKARNEGIMTARQLLLAEGSHFKNAGALAMNDLYMGGGRFENEGIVSYDNATILGQYINKSMGQMTIGKGEPTLVGGQMTVKGEGSFENQGQTTVLADLTVDEKGSVLQTGKDGKFAVDTLTLKGNGSVVVKDGEMAVAKYIDLQGGTFAVEGHAESTTKPNVALMLKDDINGRIAVDNGSLTLGLWKTPGMEGTGANQANRVGQPHAKATLIASDAPLKLGNNGTLAVGTGAKDMALTNGSAWFGSDSLFVVDTSKMTTLENGGSAALVGNGKGSLTVTEGAQLHVANVGWGTYFITKDFANEVVSEDAWAKHNSFTPEDPGKALTVKQDKDGNVLLTVGSGDIRDKHNSIASSNLVNKVIGDPFIRDVNDKGVVGFISKAVEDGIVDKNKQAEVINDVTQIGAAGGLLMQGLTLNNNVLDQVDRHLSFEDAHFKSGELQPWNTLRLWGDAIGQKSKVKGADFSGSETAFDADNMGFIVGADFMVQNDIRHGFAFAAQKGDLTTKGHLVSTTNKADSYSGVWYLGKNFGQLNVMGSLGWTHIKSDVNQSLAFMDHGAHSLDTKTDIVSGALKAELYCPLSNTLSVIPHVGVRALNVSSMDTTSKMNGEKGFRYETDAMTQWQLPLGMTLEGTHQTASGWLTRGVLDISVTPVLGDKAEKTTVSSLAVADGVQDHVTASVADSTTSAIRFGLSTEKDGLTLGGQLGVAQGDMRDRDVTFNLSARYVF